MKTPGRRVSRTLMLTIAVFFAALMVEVRAYDVGLNLADEGLVVEGARQVERGVYEPDVFAHYSSRYMFESLVLSRADNLLALRALWAILRAASAAMLFWIVTSLAGAGAAFPVVLVFLLAPGPWHKAWIPLITLLSAVAMLHFRRRPRQSTALLWGVALGLAFAIHPYTGALLWLASLPAAWRAVDASPRRWQAPALVTSGFFLGVLVLGRWVRQVDWQVFIPRHLSVIKSDWLGFHEFFWDLATGASRGLVFAATLDIMLAVLVVAFVIAIRRPAWLTPGGAADMLGLALLAAAGLPKIVARFDESHLLQNLPLFLALVGVLLGWALRAEVRRGPKIAAGLLAGWLVVFGLWSAGHTDYYFGGPGMVRGRTAVLNNAFAPLRVTPSEKQTIETVVKEIHEVAPNADDPLFVVPFAPLFYALADRPNVVPLALFDRPENLIGMTEDQILATLEKHRPGAVVRETVVTDGKDRNRFALVAPRVDAWLNENYRPRTHVGDFVVWAPQQPQPAASSPSPSAAAGVEASSSPATESSSSPPVSSSSSSSSSSTASSSP